MSPVTTVPRRRQDTNSEQPCEQWISEPGVESRLIVQDEHDSLPRSERLRQSLPDLRDALEAQVLDQSSGRILLRVFEPEDDTIRAETWYDLPGSGLRFNTGDWVLLWEDRGLILPEGEAPRPNATSTALPAGMVPAVLREEADVSEEEALRQLLQATGASEEVIERSLATLRTHGAIEQT